MNQWNLSIQQMIDWIEQNIENNPTLLQMSAQVGYSPYYCSFLFHKVCGMTLRSYLVGRRLYYVALALRDTDFRIIDIAVRYGFSSQEALTRAFVKVYGCTPYSYRTNPRPLKFAVKQEVLVPDKNLFGGIKMSNIREANVRFEHIPAHKYIGIWDIRATYYGDFWDYHNCDEVCGIIESMRHVALESVGCHQAGWFYENGKKGYFYGFGVPADYNGVVPDGFEMREVPASNYLVFFHPQFDFLAENNEVMCKVENLAWNYDPSKPDSDRWWLLGGYEWNEAECPNYQRHFPEGWGYEVLRPVRRK